MNSRKPSRHAEGGFSLLEMLMVVLIMGIVSAGILEQMNTAQQRAYTEQVRLDNLQEARDFVDQLFRDVKQAGYPNSRMVDSTAAAWSAIQPISDSRLAVGLVRIDANEIWLEGDLAGDGIVKSVRYMINGSGICPLCLQRSEVPKVAGNPLTGQLAPNWGSSADGLDITKPVFSYYKADGTPVTALPVDISTPAGAQTIASIKTIKASVTVRSALVTDRKTGQPIEITLDGFATVNNCSMAASFDSTLSPMGCK